MVDLAGLVRKLEHANFNARAQLAAEAARELSPAELDALAAGLGNEHAGVRLGVIEVLRCANHRDGVPAL
ncbi:MAG: hypothetical protein H0X17_17305, partial [Deltaproteobacteria bacterium]|nr:hypothetical protein [Deltaproteobacteria bacterium]